MCDEEVIQKSCDIVEDGFGIEEKLGEEREVLRVELVLFAVNLVERVVVFCVDVDAWRGCVAEGTCFLFARHVSCAATPQSVAEGDGNMEKAYQVPNEAQKLLTILEAPLAYIQPLDASPDELFRVEGRVPGLDEQRAEDDFEHVGPGERLL